MVRESPAKIASWLHKQHPKFRPLALSLSRLIPSMIMSGAFITSFFNFEISNYIGITGALMMILISIVSACLSVQQTKDENTALVKTFQFVKKKIDRKTKLGITFSNKDISDLLATFCEMTLEREMPVDLPTELADAPCSSCKGKGCPACGKKNSSTGTCCKKIQFGVVLRVLSAIRTLVNDFVPGWLLMTYIKDIQRIYSLEFSSSGSTRLESWYTFTDFEKAIEILEACGIFIGLVSNLVYTFVHCFQLCHCGLCKVRNIEDRIKRIGRNPICRDDTEIKGVQKTEEKSVNDYNGEEMTTNDIKQIENTIDEAEGDVGCGVVNKAFQDGDEQFETQKQSACNLKLADEGNSTGSPTVSLDGDETADDERCDESVNVMNRLASEFTDDSLSQNSIKDIIHVKMYEEDDTLVSKDSNPA